MNKRYRNQQGKALKWKQAPEGSRIFKRRMATFSVMAAGIIAQGYSNYRAISSVSASGAAMKAKKAIAAAENACQVVATTAKLYDRIVNSG